MTEVFNNHHSSLWCCSGLNKILPHQIRQFDCLFTLFVSIPPRTSRATGPGSNLDLRFPSGSEEVGLQSKLKPSLSTFPGEKLNRAWRAPGIRTDKGKRKTRSSPRVISF